MLEVKPQKVLHLHEALKLKNPKIEGNYLITPKLDGWYGYIDHDRNGWGEIRSSAGRIIPSLKWFEDIIQISFPHFIGQSARLIFEIIIPDTPFHILNGILNRKTEQAEKAILICHDLIIWGIKQTAIDRFNLLKNKFINIPGISTVPVIATTKYDPNLWEYFLKMSLDEGNEGIVMKQTDSIYQPGKRNSLLLKWKEEVTMDLEAVELFLTEGKKGNAALNLVVRRKDGVKFNVVIPKHSDRDKFLKNPDSILGKVVEIKAMSELPSGSLREPRFKCIREDKTLEELRD